VQAEYKEIAASFFVEKQPPMEACIRCLLDAIGKVRADRELENRDCLSMVKLMFDYMSSRVGSLLDRQRHDLRSAEIVPTFDSEGSPVVWRKPCEVYFKTSNCESLAAALFNLIDENIFLRAVGVRDEPSVSDICHQIIAGPEQVYAKMLSPMRYQDLLRLIASHLNTLAENTRRNLKNCKFLLATKIRSPDTTFASSGESLETPHEIAADQHEIGADQQEIASIQHLEYILDKASNIVLVDDTLLQRQFNPLCSPLDAGLESFYEALGSRYISDEVTRRYNTLVCCFDQAHHASSRVNSRVCISPIG
jgi:hypothetical protein